MQRPPHSGSGLSKRAEHQAERISTGLYNKSVVQLRGVCTPQRRPPRVAPIVPVVNCVNCTAMAEPPGPARDNVPSASTASAASTAIETTARVPCRLGCAGCGTSSRTMRVMVNAGKLQAKNQKGNALKLHPTPVHANGTGTGLSV